MLKTFMPRVAPDENPALVWKPLITRLTAGEAKHISGFPPLEYTTSRSSLKSNSVSAPLAGVAVTKKEPSCNVLSTRPAAEEPVADAAALKIVASRFLATALVAFATSY